MKMYSTPSYKAEILEFEVDKSDKDYVWATFYGKQTKFKKHCRGEDICDTFEEAKDELICREKDKIERYSNLLKQAEFNLKIAMDIKEPTKASNINN